MHYYLMWFGHDIHAIFMCNFGISNKLSACSYKPQPCVLLLPNHLTTGLLSAVILVMLAKLDPSVGYNPSHVLCVQA